MNGQAQGQPAQAGGGQMDKVRQMAAAIIKAIMAGQTTLAAVMQDPNIPQVVKQIVMAFVKQQAARQQAQQGGGMAPQGQPQPQQ